jgi:hypothetical protein
MALSIQELTNLESFLNGHSIVDYVSDSNQEIIDWLDSKPTPAKSFQYVIFAFPESERGKLFIVRDVAAWYGELCLKVANNTDTIVNSLGNNDIDRKKELRRILGLFIADLSDMGLLDKDMQSLLVAFMKRNFNALLRIFYLLIADNILTEKTVNNVLVELNSNYKRWESVGLSASPTIEELELIINT